MCALEAMALGVPIVSTPTDGMCELVENGKTGYLSDEDEILTEQILQLLQSRESRHQMSENTLMKAEKDNDTVCYREKIHEAYRKVIRND